MFKLMKFMQKNDRILIFFCFFLTFLRVICDLAQPFLLSDVSDAVGENMNGDVWKFIGIMIALAIASFIFGGITIFTSGRLAVRVCGGIRFALYNKIQNFTGPEIDKLTTPSLITRITNDIAFYQNTLIMVLRTLLRSGFVFVGGIIAAFVYSSLLKANIYHGNQNLWWLAFIFLGCVFLLSLIICFIIPLSIPYFRKQQKETDKTNAVMRENILGIKVVKSFNMEKSQTDLFNIQNNRLKRVSNVGQQIGLSLQPLIQFFVQVSIVVILMVAAVFMNNSGAAGTLGIVLSFIQMVSFVVSTIVVSVNTIVNVTQNKACSDRILEVFGTKTVILKNTSNNMITNSKVEFKNVSFKYTSNPEALNVLQNISFEAKPGEMIGIIGPTGSGKSTLVNLITRNYDVKVGEIIISGFNVKEINYHSLRDSIGFSPQKSVLFSGTIRSNILFGKNDATNQEIIEAAKLAEALEFIKNKENGLDAVVTQRGENFSGGQKQRISIARALVRQPKILILDDSTSALDMITEAKVQQNIRSLKKSTIFLVGQRIAAISRADKIIVLDQGKMVGYGNHEQLMKKCSLYKEIAQSQIVETSK